MSIAATLYDMAYMYIYIYARTSTLVKNSSFYCLNFFISFTKNSQSGVDLNEMYTI